MRREVCGINQQILEQRAHDNIHMCNEHIRRTTATYNNWDGADEKLRTRYTREEFKEMFVDHWRKERRRWVEQLQRVRQGYVLE